MSELSKKVAQTLIIGVPSTVMNDLNKKLLKDINPGGVIHFKHNYEGLESLVTFNRGICDEVCKGSYEGLPPWIGVDQEGGRVMRFGEPFLQIPAQEVWAKAGSPKLCFEIACTVATELAAAGININFAPVLDVRQFDTPAIGDRAFSKDPQVVAEMGSAVIRGFQKGGVLAVAKHFPGHGAVEVDSHFERPLCNKTVEELENCDWIPYRKAFKSKLEAVMTSHIVFPKIDPDNVATFSTKILKDLLREKLNFKGLIFGDDLEMKAVSSTHSLKEAAVASLRAGCEQIFITHAYGDFIEVFEELVRAVEKDPELQENVENICRKVKTLKEKYIQKEINLDEAKKIVGCKNHQILREKLTMTA